MKIVWTSSTLASSNQGQGHSVTLKCFSICNISQDEILNTASSDTNQVFSQKNFPSFRCSVIL